MFKARIPTRLANVLKHAEHRTPRVLITGGGGQLGPELAVALREQLGKNNVVVSDLRLAKESEGPAVHLDVTDRTQFHEVAANSRANVIIHLAALLSATSEKNPTLALAVNGRGVEHALEVAALQGARIFVPSSIAAFGKSTPRTAPDETLQRPEFIYGVHKVYAEILGEWYARAKGVDFRSLRYPGVVSWKSPPGGGTTDWAVESYWKAVEEGRFNCFVASDTKMPMVYVDDLVKGTLEFLFCDKKKLTKQVYNLPGCSFTPADQVQSIRRHYKNFQVDYNPDFRQQLALSWPQVIESDAASNDWGWKAEYSLDGMTDEMIKNIRLMRNKLSAQ
jgi:threonine 3-dehydrogenase